jgi:hypothetical protein
MASWLTQLFDYFTSSAGIAKMQLVMRDRMVLRELPTQQRGSNSSVGGLGTRSQKEVGGGVSMVPAVKTSKEYACLVVLMDSAFSDGRVVKLRAEEGVYLESRK